MKSDRGINTMRGFIGTVAILCVVMLSGCATSVLTAPCQSPNVSSSALPVVYMVVVPYVGNSETELSQAHEKAAQTVTESAGLQALRMASDTTDMHVTLLYQDDARCEIEQIYQKFTEEKGRLNRKLLSTVVFFWGEVYEIQGSLQIQSHLRILWKDNDDQFVNVYVQQPENAPPLKFAGYLPYSTISFPPRQLLVNDGAGLTRDPRLKFVARSARRDDAEEVPLPSRFSIVERSGKWVEIQGRDDKRSAWISVQDGGAGIMQLLPELSFANAVASYISYGKNYDEDAFKNTRKWLDEFKSGAQENVDSRELIRPSAVAEAIEGALYLRAIAPRTGYRDRARLLLDKAATSLSTNSAVLNLAAVSEMDVCCSNQRISTRIHRRMQLAYELDAGNKTIARNLLNWYRLLETKPREVWPEGVSNVQQPARELAQLLGER
ncbi:hypothetical protein PEC18_29620 [Paucibacter sp. O1-1]|nr:hypothetical protein [Paucibacter sp. O1-1]MCU7374898.1 hypothetical protein [Paucibacter sp. O1-1]MDA3829896.1 hypothetical protein [Paucibacter sp. O1-1]MDA3829900.1 hypothetical protein [Paucibacter sp. O1-1]